MILKEFRDIFGYLIAARTNADVHEVLRLLGDHPALGLGEKFGPFGLAWQPFGDNPSNISTIGLATKPGRSLTERLTNAMDALLEDRAIGGVALPHSAREAAQQWFGRNITGPDDGLFRSNMQNVDRRISVVLLSSEETSAATIDVLDQGIGIKPENFSTTILSLQEGNKIQKRYLIGAFGQGGASTLAFSDYVFIASRHRDDLRRVGFTLIRVLNLDSTYKEDCYAYLSAKDGGGRVIVPSFAVDDEALTIYPDSNEKLLEFRKGTLVRHYSFTLSKLDKTLQASPGNLYHYLHSSLFDPLLPLRIIDVRQSGKEKNELIAGSRNRLMKLAKDAQLAKEEQKETAETEEDDGSGSRVVHHRPMEYVVPFGSEDPSIGIEYWVVLNYRKVKGKGTILRGNSNELYVQPNHPIIATMNGQNQGEITGQLLREIGLGIVSRHMIVHIDATNASSQIRRQLFSTNREGLKDGDVLDELLRVLTKMLKEDQVLFSIERDLTERIARKETEATSEEVRRQVSKLLVEAGFQLKQSGPTFEPGGGEKHPTLEKRRGKPVQFQPLPTLPFPQVTKFEIVTPKPIMNVRLNDNEVVLVETDADSEFDKRGLLAIRTEPAKLELAGRSPLRGGRLRWRLRPSAEANAGDKGTIIVTLTKPDGTQLTDSCQYEVAHALEEKTKKAKGTVPPFDIIPINPEDNPEQWALAWPDTFDEASLDDLRKLAYKPIRQGDGISVYYSTIFSPYEQQMELLKTENQSLMQLFKTEYEIWIAYHAILQENEKPAYADDLAVDKLQESERIRVAHMQVKQALHTAKMRERLLKEAAASP